MAAQYQVPTSGLSLPSAALKDKNGGTAHIVASVDGSIEISIKAGAEFPRYGGVI
jgi:hypothetical protein